MSRRRRADVLLVERGLASSRARAQALLLAGRVYSGERRVEKAGAPLAPDAELQVREALTYVSRGGVKLAGALDAFSLDVRGLVCLDIGASTGGFTDCLLQRGARRVHAVDVGHGQLHPKLRGDARVVVMEKTNARHLTADAFSDPIDLVVVDASFIGIGKLAPVVAMLLPTGRQLLCLVKPQFEAGREAARKARGVLRDEGERSKAIDAALADLVASGFTVLHRADSVLAGPKGNVEHFVLAERA